MSASSEIVSSCSLLFAAVYSELRRPAIHLPVGGVCMKQSSERRIGVDLAVRAIDSTIALLPLPCAEF